MPTYNITYFATAGDNKIITAGKAVLHRIIIGKDVASSVIEISDSASDGDENLKAQIEGSTLMTANGGCVEFGTVFANGIAMDLTNQTNVSVVWEPTA